MHDEVKPDGFAICGLGQDRGSERNVDVLQRAGAGRPQPGVGEVHAAEHGKGPRGFRLGGLDFLRGGATLGVSRA